MNAVLATLFEWGVALHHLETDKLRTGEVKWSEKQDMAVDVAKKISRQVGKDYIVFPALTGPAWKSTMAANAVANLIRNYWSYAVIFCGHFPDGAEKFTLEEYENETPAQWYLRQMLGSANFQAGPLMAFMSGNLCYQIEHHCFPDLPSNRYTEIAVPVRELCDKYDLPYTTGPLWKQYGQTLRTIWKLSLPNRFLSASSGQRPRDALRIEVPHSRRAEGGSRRRPRDGQATWSANCDRDGVELIGYRLWAIERTTRSPVDWIA